MKNPAFCPNHECKNHFSKNIKKDGSRWFYKAGFYKPQTSLAPVQRYRCKTCGRCFSENTFSVHYCSKKIISLKKIMRYLASGVSIRAMARLFGCAPDTINRKIGILARQVSALMENIQDELELSEDLAADGFESFAVSQYFPNNFNILVGKESQFVYHFNYLQLRRKGRMTEYQKKKAKKLKETWPIRSNNERLSFLEIEQKTMQMAVRSSKLEKLKLFTDEKREYRQCLTKDEPVAWHDGMSIGFEQKRVSSRKLRDLRNDLFAVNYMDREIRKDLAEHHRETTCFARNVNSSVSRMMCYFFYHNFYKKFRLNGKSGSIQSHAEAAGIERKIYSSMRAHIFSKRFFISKQELRGNNEMTWCRAYRTPLKWRTDSLPAYALAG